MPLMSCQHCINLGIFEIVIGVVDLVSGYINQGTWGTFEILTGVVVAAMEVGKTGEEEIEAAT